MSYCRFSSDDWRSEIYCYEGDKFAIHVAAQKHKCVSAPDWPTIPPDADVDTWVRVSQEQGARLQQEGDLVPIGLPYDGHTFYEDTLESCMLRLLELRDLGYHVPQGALDRLAEEIRDEKLQD